MVAECRGVDSLCTGVLLYERQLFSSRIFRSSIIIVKKSFFLIHNIKSGLNDWNMTERKKQSKEHRGNVRFIL